MGCWAWLSEVLGEVGQYKVINNLDLEDLTTVACVLTNSYLSFMTEIKPRFHH